MIEKIIKLLNDVSKIQIINAYTTQKPPKKPFATYSTLFLDSKDYFGGDIEEKVDKKNIKEFGKYREIATIQFDVYATSEIECLQKARELQQLILFKLRYYWSRVGVGIAGFSNIKSFNELIQESYEFRSTFDIKFEYIVTTERKTEIIELIEIIAKQFKEEEEQ